MNSEQESVAPLADESLAGLVSQVEDFADQHDQGTPEERLLERVAAVLRQQQAEIERLKTPPADEGLAKLVDKLGWIAAQLGALSWTDDDATVVQSALLLQRQQARITELEERLEGLKPVPASERLRRCPTHGQQPANSWGCPECVRELREQLAAQACQPVPVGERPWERDGWLNSDGLCWWADDRSPLWWTLVDPTQLGERGWLAPAHCLPIPQEES